MTDPIRFRDRHPDIRLVQDDDFFHSVLVGMGCAVQLPLAFAAAANLGRSGTSLAIVFVSAYAGALVSPALIGFAADRVGLRAAMMIPLVGAVVVVSLAGNLSPRSGVAPTPLPAGR